MNRAAAEAQLNDNWVAQQPDLLLLGLAQFVANNSEVQVRRHILDAHAIQC